MLQAPWIEEKCRVTLIGLVGFSGNTTRIGRQIRLLGTAGGNRVGYSGQRVDRVTQDSRGNQDGGLGQQADRVTRVSRGN
jgi:hypothetical protein